MSTLYGKKTRWLPATAGMSRCWQFSVYFEVQVFHIALFDSFLSSRHLDAWWKEGVDTAGPLLCASEWELTHTHTHTHTHSIHANNLRHPRSRWFLFSLKRTRDHSTFRVGSGNFHEVGLREFGDANHCDVAESMTIHDHPPPSSNNYGS